MGASLVVGYFRNFSIHNCESAPKRRCGKSHGSGRITANPEVSTLGSLHVCAKTVSFRFASSCGGVSAANAADEGVAKPSAITFRHSTEDEIRPLFKNAPANVVLPEDWR
jgi:hypothetical protein